MTDLRTTQVSAEVWVASPAADAHLLTTQVSAEVWAISPRTAHVRVTQVSAESWAASKRTAYVQSTQISAEVWVASQSTLREFIKGVSSIQFGIGVTGAPLTTPLIARMTTASSIKFGITAAGPEPAPTPLFDWRITVISQYMNSPILLKLLENFFEYVDPTLDLEAFYDLVWNVDTAQGYGLDVWGRIVGVNRVLQLTDLGKNFGFQEADDVAQPWNQGVFWGGPGATQNFYLSDTAYRTLIFAKALSNICDGSIPAINQLLINLFGPFNPGGGANAYVTDDGSMAMTYKFEFTPTPVQLAIISQSGVLPKPVGVLVSIDVP